MDIITVDVEYDCKHDNTVKFERTFKQIYIN